MTVLNLDSLQGTTFVLGEILDVFEQVDSILAGASSAFSISLSGDSGTTQTIVSGNTIHIGGGNGIATVAESTDTVRVVVDLSPVAGNSLSFDPDGKLFGRDVVGEDGGGGTTYQPKYIINDVSHGFGSAGAIVLLSGDFTLALANNLNTTADYVALIIDANSYYLLGAGFHTLTGHGLTQGAWYALSNTVAGSYELSYLLDPEDTRQNAFICVDANSIYVDLEEADAGRVVPEASKVAQTAHGFAVGDIVSRVGSTWVDGIAGEVCYFVKEITDANNFIISQVWSGSRTCTAGKLYCIDPAVDGAIIDVSTLDASVDPITRVGYATKTNYLAGFCEFPLLCCGSSTPPPDPGTLIFAESWEGGAHQNSYSDAFGFASGNLTYVNNSSQSTEGDYYLKYTTTSGNTDFNTYEAVDTLSPAKSHVLMKIDFAFINVLSNVSALMTVFEDVSGGMLAGIKATVADGFQCRYFNNAASETLDGLDYPSTGLAVDTWYRITMEVEQSSAEDVADGQIKWKVETLQGSLSGGSDGTVVSTLIAERTIGSLVTHNASAPVAFNKVRVAGNYISRSAGSISGDWGVAYDNFSISEIA